MSSRSRSARMGLQGRETNCAVGFGRSRRGVGEWEDALGILSGEQGGIAVGRVMKDVGVI